VFAQNTQDSINKTTIYLADVVIGQGVDTSLIPKSKIYQALNFVTLLSNKYAMIPPEMISETIKQSDTNQQSTLSYMDIAKKLDADRLYIIKIEQLINIIRCEIISANPKQSDSAEIGEGFSVIHLFKKKDNMPLFDPILVTAVQRAFAIVENDSLMFMKLEPPYNVKPVPALVVGGFVFNNDVSLPQWIVFNNPLVNSYEFTELTYEEIYTTPDWLVYDQDSRDGIYAMFKLVLPVNNIAPSYNELDALRKFNVNYYILGDVTRIKKGIKFSLSLYENTAEEQKQIKTVTETLTENFYPDAQEVVRRLAKKLIMD
jgi:hypothetical protein